MKAYSPFVTSVATLLVFVPFGVAQAQVLLAPTGQSLDGYWVGFNFSDPLATRFVDEGSSVGSLDLYFEAPEGYYVTPGWGGAFTGSLQSHNTGTETGVDAGFVRYNPGPIWLSDLTNEYLAASGTFLGSSSGVVALDGSTTWTYNFASMDLGYLPAGTPIYIGDLDTTSGGEGPIYISSNVSTQFMDLTWQGDAWNGGTPGNVTPPNVYWDSLVGEFSVVAAGAGNNETDVTLFVTTENLTSLTFSTNLRSSAGSHAVFIAAPALPVPEPSGALLIALTGSFALLRRNRAV